MWIFHFVPTHFAQNDNVLPSLQVDFSLVSLTQNDKSAVIARFANLKRAFTHHYQAKHKNTSNRHCEQGISLARQSTNSKQTLFKPLLYGRTKPNPFQSLTLRQNKTQPTLFCKKASKFQDFTPWNFKWADLNLATKTKRKSKSCALS